MLFLAFWGSFKRDFNKIPTHKNNSSRKMKHKSISLYYISEQNVILATENDHQCIMTITFIFFAILVDLPLKIYLYLPESIPSCDCKKRVLVTEVR